MFFLRIISLTITLENVPAPGVPLVPIVKPPPSPAPISPFTTAALFTCIFDVAPL